MQIDIDPLATSATTATQDRENTMTDNNAFYDSMFDPLATSATTATWDSEPIPLFKQATASESYPVSELGDVLGDALQELAQTVQAPVSLIANSLLAAAGLVSQPYANVRLLHGSIIPISLFALTVGDSGERKSAIDGYVLAPVKAYQKKLAEQCNTDKISYEIERQAYDAAARQAKATGGKKKKSIDDIRDELQSLGSPPTPPIEPLILCSDPTAEGIFRQLSGGQPSIGIFTDEGGLFTSGYAMQDTNKLATLARMSKLWSGDAFDRVRGGDGVSILYNRRMSLHLMMQGIVARALFSDSIANEQGFLPRCLIAFPDTTAGDRFFVDRDPMHSKALKRYYAVMSDILESPKPTSETDKQQLTPPTLELNHHARAMLIQFHDDIERQLKPDGEYFVIKGTANKIVEHAARIAGVITIIEHGANAANDGIMIDETIMTKAITLAKWYLNEWRRIYSVAAIPETIQLAELLQQWVLSDKNVNKPYFHARQVLRLGHNRLRAKSALDAAILTLEEHGLCRQVDQMMLGGAIRKTVYEVRFDDFVANVATVASPLTCENSVLGSNVATVATVARGSDYVNNFDVGSNAVQEEVF
jgi:putative DNA primase/helicase